MPWLIETTSDMITVDHFQFLLSGWLGGEYENPAGWPSWLAARDQEHQIGGGVAGRVAAVMNYYGRRMPPMVQIRLHDTPLYNSIYRFDDEMLVNVHVYGMLAAYTPTLHLRRVDGAWFNTYLESFERVWASARPWERGAAA